MRRYKKSLLSSAIFALGFSGPIGHAEDIDIYAAGTSVANNPNILIVIDNSANWSSASQHWPGGIKQGESELRAVRTVIGELDSSVNVGLMLFTPATGSNPDGSYVRFHVRPMNQGNKSAFSEMIGYASGCDEGPNSLNATPNCILKNFDTATEKVGTAKTNYSSAMFEVFKYFGGYTSPAHATDDQAGSPVDASHFGPLRYSGDPDSKSDPAAYDATKTSYVSPLTGATASCAKNYVIFIGNGFPSADTASTLLSEVGGSTAQLLMPNFTTGTTNETTLLETTACGTYSSTAACQSAAATKYGTAYSSYSCSVANTCSAGSTIVSTSARETLCRADAYTSLAECNTAEAAKNTANKTYACSAQAACSATILNPKPEVPVVDHTGCIAKSTIMSGGAIDPAKCTTYANSLNLSFSGFTCATVPANSCSGSTNDFAIYATAEKISRNTYTVTETTTTSSTDTTTSHNISGTRSVFGSTPTNTASLPTTSNLRYTDEWAKFLYSTDVSALPGRQNVKTFTIDVYKDQQDSNETALLMSMANAGGGKYFSASSEDAIMSALRKILAEIQSVNSVFASSSLPVSVNTQGTYLNQVFIGMFRPDAGARPRWAGNLKQYQLKFFGSALNMADKNGERAISSTTGFMSPCANSVWSSDSGQYWSYVNSLAIGNCTAQTSRYPTTGSTSAYSDAPDGDIVEKGGAAQKLRGTGDSSGSLVSSSTRYAVCGVGESPTTHACRNLKTIVSSGASLSLIDFTATNASLDSDATVNSALVDWVRGKDIDNENGNYTSAAATPPNTAIIDEVRPSVHGGVIHSQPAVVDYGGTTGVIAFYGSDDGVFHAVEGGKTDAKGRELWGFIPPEFFSKFNRQRDNGTNTPLINFPKITGSVAPKDYFFDGSIGVYQKPEESKVLVFPTMRRGGRAIYAFDVSAPASPTLMWRKGCFTSSTTDDTNCSTGWSDIGQTWSKPQITKIEGYANPVLVFGGGYDTCEDVDSATRCSSTPRKGAKVWFVDAMTGTILRTYPTNYSVTGEIALLKNASGYLRYAYAGDTGGNLYRINVDSISGSTPSSAWTSNTLPADTQIAALSVTGQPRKFFYGPDVFEFLGLHYISIGSGNREQPLWATAGSSPTGCDVSDQFYIVKDDPAVAQSGTGILDVTPTNLTDITNGTTTLLDDIGIKGWRMSLQPCEKTVNKALVVGGFVFFGTNQAVDTVTTPCSNNLGVARTHSINITTGEIFTNTLTGGGLPPSAVAGVVQLDDGTKVPFCIGCGAVSAETVCSGPGCSPQESQEVPVTPPPTRSRVYWYMQSD
jgi:Tfp pilus tip-associated adhesin PilY1